jgi:predicted translin family RNA/ssDNA-binding protein
MESPSKKRKVSATSNKASPKPLAPPARFVGGDGNPDSPFRTGLSDMKEKLLSGSQKREQINSIAKELRHLTQLTLASFFSAADLSSLDENLTEISLLAQSIVEKVGSKAEDQYLLSMSLVEGALSDAQALENLAFFISNGHLARSRSEQKISGVTGVWDSVYLGGIIKTCHSLERYSVGRATQGDRASVKVCGEFVEALLSKLMEFNFRNGPLRRAYDGVKYAHKRLGDILYETSLCKGVTEEDVLPNQEKIPVDMLLPVHDLEEIRLKLDAYDEKREHVIKKCRDVQKLSKQAIFSLHREEKEKARKQLDTAMSKAQAISSEFNFQSEPSLRSGSFQNAMEEWVEGRLFEAWLDSDGTKILSTAELQAELTSPLKMTSEEYLGGLVDFTGEIGRWAVLKATQRDKEAVEKALSADLTVEAAMILLDTAMPGKMNKKVGALRNNVKKLEQLLYELSLLTGTGKKAFTSTAKPSEDSESSSSSSKL